MEKSIEEQVKSRIYDAKNCTSYEEEFRSLIKQNNELREKQKPVKPNILDLSLDPKKYGMEQCGHCNGYGSSLKEASPICTQCEGSGLQKMKKNLYMITHTHRFGTDVNIFESELDSDDLPEYEEIAAKFDIDYEPDIDEEFEVNLIELDKIKKL